MAHLKRHWWSNPPIFSSQELTIEYLGWHVNRRSNYRSVSQRFRATEAHIGYLRRVISVNQDILQFYVTMTQAITMKTANAIDNFMCKSSSIASIVFAELFTRGINMRNLNEPSTGETLIPSNPRANRSCIAPAPGALGCWAPQRAHSYDRWERQELGECSGDDAWYGLRHYAIAEVAAGL